jgi:hypothetical protein
VAIVLSVALGRVTALQVSPPEEMAPANTTGRPLVRVPQATQAVDDGQITLVSEATATLPGMVSAVKVPGVVVLSARITPCDVVPVRPYPTPIQAMDTHATDAIRVLVALDGLGGMDGVAAEDQVDPEANASVALGGFGLVVLSQPCDKVVPSPSEMQVI